MNLDVLFNAAALWLVIFLFILIGWVGFDLLVYQSLVRLTALRVSGLFILCFVVVAFLVLVVQVHEEGEKKKGGGTES